MKQVHTDGNGQSGRRKEKKKKNAVLPCGHKGCRSERVVIVLLSVVSSVIEKKRGMQC